jgi:GTP cyclohydrolase II
MTRMAAEGGGVLLYLRQEGRGIGLVNKLRAYRLQDQGLDTVDANTHLGFEPDERDFAIAAQMLRRLGIGHVRLLTNNPEKLTALSRHGVEVRERVPLAFAANRHNRTYLETKARRAGHLLRVIDGGLNCYRHAEVSGG